MNRRTARNRWRLKQKAVDMLGSREFEWNSKNWRRLTKPFLVASGVPIGLMVKK